MFLQVFFGGPDQPKTLERIPLETFDRGTAWLRRQPGVDPNRIGVVGQSKGAEAALLIGTRHPEIRAVVAAAPSNVVWRGVDAEWPLNPDPSWTDDGKDLPSLGYSIWRPWRKIGSVYEAGLRNLDDHPETKIAIENVTAPVLLLCGESDNLWPACEMSRDLVRRGGPSVELLAYRDAGHTAFGPPVPRDHPALTESFVGGTADGNFRARTDSWPKVLAFLGEHLA